MTFLRWWTAALALAGTSIAICLGVVCIQYALYMETEPRLQNDWPKLITATTLFAVLGVVGAVSFWALHRRTRWLWPMQAVLLATALILGRIFWQLLGS